LANSVSKTIVNVTDALTVKTVADTPPAFSGTKRYNATQITRNDPMDTITLLV